MARAQPKTPAHLEGFPTFLQAGHPDFIASHAPAPETPLLPLGAIKRTYWMPDLKAYDAFSGDNSPLSRRTDEWRDERAYPMVAAIADGCDTFYKIRVYYFGVYTHEEMRSGLRRAAEQHWVIQRGRRYFIDEVKARRAIMEGKMPKFDKTKVEAALSAMGYNVDVRDQTLKALEMIEDAAKCREFVGKVQGEDAVKGVDAVSMERYRKRAEKIIREFTETPAEPAAESADATQTAGAAGDSKKENTTMASKSKKVAKKAAKKTNVAKSAGPQKVGVIETLIETLKHAGSLTKKGYTVEQLTAALAKKFPDRKADAMKATIKIQLSRLPRDKKANVKSEQVESSNNKVYWIA